MSARESILVLGGNGFIGSYFLKQLLSQKEGKDIWVLIRDATKAAQLERSGCKVIVGDFTKIKWEKTGVEPGRIYHFARNSGSRGKWSRLNAAKKGAKGNKNLLKYLESKPKESKLYYLSGSLMYGNSEKPVDESHALNPISFAKEYRKAELPFENHKGKVKVCLLRVPWVLGNGSWFQSFFLQFMENKNLVPLWGNGSNEMSFVSRAEIAGFLLAIDSTPFHPVVNLAIDYSCTQKEFVATLSSLYNKPIKEYSLKKHEKAIQEAFTSSIKLVSNYNHCNYLKDVSDEATFRQWLHNAVK